jgi:hypothetical protein
MRGPKEGTGTSSGQRSTASTAAWWHSQQVTASERTPCAPHVRERHRDRRGGGAGHRQASLWSHERLALRLLDRGELPGAEVVDILGDLAMPTRFEVELRIVPAISSVSFSAAVSVQNRWPIGFTR